MGVVTGATPDSETPVLLACQQVAANQPLPPAFIRDRAGGNGACRAHVDAVSDGYRQMVAHIALAGGRDPDRFGPADFRVTSDQTACTCPQGVTTTQVYRQGAGDIISFRFLASHWRGCPLWERCRSPDSNGKGHRTVFVREHQAYLRLAAAFKQTPQGQALLAQRWRGEPTVAWLVGYQGCQGSRRVGQLAAHCQL